MRPTLTAEELIAALKAQTGECAEAALTVVRTLDRFNIVSGSIVDTDSEFTVNLECKTRDGSLFTMSMDLE